MKITMVFALTFLSILLVVSAQASDEANAVLQTERDLAAAYQKGDADGIAQGVMEDYTLTNSMAKSPRGLTILPRQRKTIRNTKSSRITT